MPPADGITDRSARFDRQNRRESIRQSDVDAAFMYGVTATIVVTGMTGKGGDPPETIGS